jgi:phosphoglycerate dehydrogenase-like enzyme
MKHLRIYVDLALSEIALELLKKGTTGHQLLFPQKPTASVLHKAERDPQFATADVAFGQPDPEAIAECPHLKWVHISSSGITRYDNAAFRRMVEDRNMPVSNSATVYSEACAVHALSFILAQARCLPAALNTRASNGTVAWKALRGSSKTLRGETVLIVGYGAAWLSSWRPSR